MDPSEGLQKAGFVVERVQSPFDAVMPVGGLYVRRYLAKRDSDKWESKVIVSGFASDKAAKAYLDGAPPTSESILPTARKSCASVVVEVVALKGGAPALVASKDAIECP